MVIGLPMGKPPSPALANSLAVFQMDKWFMANPIMRKYIMDAEMFQEVDARENRRSKRAPPVLNRNLEDGPASIYTIRTRSRRVNTGQALVYKIFYIRHKLRF